MSYTVHITEWDTVKFSEIKNADVKEALYETYAVVKLIRLEDDLYVRLKSGEMVKLLYAIRTEHTVMDC
jgi:hypothetical protein